MVYFQTIQINTGGDNLDVDPGTGDIYLGAHYVMYKLLQGMKNPKHYKMPSQVCYFIPPLTIIKTSSKYVLKSHLNI